MARIQVPKTPRPAMYVKDKVAYQYYYYPIQEKAMTSFFNKSNAPHNILKRTDTKYKSMPLSALKEDGMWNNRLSKIIPYIPKGAWLAGGFLRSMIAGEDELSGDIDFFFNSEDSFDKMLELIKHPVSGAEKAFGYYSIPEYESVEKLRIIDCTSLVSFRPNIQLVRLFWFDSPEHVIDSFDFTVCQFATDGETLWFNPQAFEDIKTKTLKQNRETGDAIAILNRVLKYQSKGYKISAEDFQTVENNAVKTLNSNDIIQHFYNDKTESDIHRRSETVLQRAWEYLETAPASAAAYANAMKKKSGIGTTISGQTYTITGISAVDNLARIKYSWDGS